MQRSTKKILILALVFFTGACSLVVEVVALRVLSPFFGNTIFTASSVIGTVLGALSLGYYLGGRLADKHGTAAWICGLVLAAGLSVLSIEFIQTWALPVLAPRFSLTSGPLVASVVLFFLPSLFLGAISPFAVAILHNDAAEGVARLTGSVFFWSTLGSIAGSLLSGFVLIPNFGIDRILLGVGFVLSAVGLLPRLFLGLNRRRLLGLVAFAIVGVGGLASWQTRPTVAGTVYSQDGVYEALTVRDGSANGRPTRFFLQDKSFSGAMYLDADATVTQEGMVFDYTKYYAAYRAFKPQLKRALIIGGGAYTVPKALLKDPGVETVEVAEIEPSLFDLAKKYFGVPEDARLVNRVADGRRVVVEADKPYDLIFSDVYFSLFSIPAHFTTLEFFQAAKSKLTPDGVFIANLIGDLSRQEPSFLMSELKTIRQAFPNAVSVSDQKNRDLQNIMIIAVNSAADDAEVARKIAPMVNEIGGELVDLGRFDVDSHVVFTDNYVPIDFYTASAIRRTARYADAAYPDGQEMLAMVKQQVSYGSRALGAFGHEAVKNMIVAETRALGLEVLIQDWSATSSDGGVYRLSNVIARLNPQASRRYMIAAHYDTRFKAEKDAARPDGVMPGANDGASGVAALLEIARVLAQDNRSDMGFDFVFFDGEEGLPNDREWQTHGSRHFVDNLADVYPNGLPVGGIVLDMVCATDNKLLPEVSSLRDAARLTRAFWSVALESAPEYFGDDSGPEILDDHTALNQAGIPSFLVIGWDYPYFHTTQDTPDKCSADKLQAVAGSAIRFAQTLP